MRRRRQPVDPSFMAKIGALGGRQTGKKRHQATIRKLMEQLYERDKENTEVGQR
jgi:hypothetical protein